MKERKMSLINKAVIKHGVIEPCGDKKSFFGVADH